MSTSIRFGYSADEVSYAICSASESVGELVYTNLTKTGDLYNVSKVDITSYSKMPAIGVIISKQSTTRCRVKWSGPIRGIYSGLTPGRMYFVGSDSKPTLAFPTVAGTRLQKIGSATSTNELYLKPSTEVFVRS